MIINSYYALPAMKRELPLSTLKMFSTRVKITRRRKQAGAASPNGPLVINSVQSRGIPGKQAPFCSLHCHLDFGLTGHTF